MVVDPRANSVTNPPSNSAKRKDTLMSRKLAIAGLSIVIAIVAVVATQRASVPGGMTADEI